MGHKILGRDAYNVNFAMLMIMTAVEVGAVAASVQGAIVEEMVILILVTIGAIKFLGIAFVFMHLRFEEDSNILTLTALFPGVFILMMIVFIAITTPGAPASLPAVCRF